MTISGGRTLRGEVTIQGSKTSAQMILPATVLFPGTYLIRNVPHISDVASLLRILVHLGAAVARFRDGAVLIDTRQITSSAIPSALSGQSAASFLFAGALLGRTGAVEIGPNGGDPLGDRNINWHLDAFRSLGATVSQSERPLQIHAFRLRGGRIQFPRSTVHGTANALLAATRAAGTTTIDNAASEPEIDQLVTFLNSLGAAIGRVARNRIRVDGSASRSSAVYSEVLLMPDRIDAGTFLVAALLAGDRTIQLHKTPRQHLEPLIGILREAGAELEWRDQTLVVQSDGRRFAPLRVQSGPYPAFATDWGPALQVLMTQIAGVSTFHETIFSERFGHITELMRMGAHVEFFNPEVPPSTYHFKRSGDNNRFHAACIEGETPLHGELVSANDIRGAAALTLAGLIAGGVTLLRGVNHIERGHESFVDRLRSLGASLDLAPAKDRRAPKADYGMKDEG